ncbi:MAG TPA: glycosyltransferase family 2 protein [Candidatus Omnitrophota bacterium]|nr:glycosyltransferase family 2 protein [Candidatus Omnitrophota bacterium]HPN55678.1 glycosyltransferase family 2 protein [Candidatus Omnitrophota bacterium]
MLELSVVIPVYNSKKFIVPAVEELTALCDRQEWAYEILLRDDGSSDDSAGVLRLLSGKHPRVRCVFNERNRGLGFTLRRLFEEAKGRTVVYCDVDLPFGVGVFRDLVALNKKHDLVVVSRYLSAKQGRIPFLRKAVSRLYFGLCRMLFQVRVFDIGSGTVAFSREALTRIPLHADGFDIHIEIMTAFHNHGCSILEIPAPYSEKGPGTFSILRHGPRVVIDTVRLWRKSFKK